LYLLLNRDLVSGDDRVNLGLNLFLSSINLFLNLGIDGINLGVYSCELNGIGINLSFDGINLGGDTFDFLLNLAGKLSVELNFEILDLLRDVLFDGLYSPLPSFVRDF
jgi:hypothetical protein